MITTFPSKRRFWFHYNKPASLAAGEPRLSVHVANSCHIVSRLHCLVPIFSHNQSQQPRLVMRGFCMEVEILDGIMRIS